MEEPRTASARDSRAAGTWASLKKIDIEESKRGPETINRHARKRVDSSGLD